MGKVVIYTTTLGVIRETYARQVKAILSSSLSLSATLLIKRNFPPKQLISMPPPSVYPSRRCVKVRQILRTLLIRVEERDVFMSRENQG